MSADHQGTPHLVAAEARHAAAIAAIHARLFHPPWSPDAVAGLLGHAGSLALIALAPAGGEVAGYILGRIAADEAEILSIAVAPEWQRRGWGGLLLRDWLARALSAGATRAVLEAAADNIPALALYRGHGFGDVGRRCSYYAEPGGKVRDAVILAIEIDRSRSVTPVGGRFGASSV